MKKKILLTTDLSEQATRAFEPTCELAERLNANITMLYVVPTLTKVDPGGIDPVPAMVPDPEQTRVGALEALEKQSAALGSDHDITIEVLISPSVSDAVADFAEENGFDMIAMSTHGRSGLRRMILGSIAEGILRKTRVPVICFPPAK